MFPISIVRECQTYSQFHIHNFWSQTLSHDFEPTLILPEAYQYEGPKPRIDASYLYKLHPFTFSGQEKRVRLKKQRVLLGLVQILLICIFHFKSFVSVTPRYLILSAFSRTVPSKVSEARILMHALCLTEAYGHQGGP